MRLGNLAAAPRTSLSLSHVRASPPGGHEYRLGSPIGTPQAYFTLRTGPWGLFGIGGRRPINRSGQPRDPEAVGGQDDTYGFALAAHPGKSQGRPPTNTGSKPIE